MSSKIPEEKKDKELTFEEREEKDRQRIKEIEMLEAKNFPKLNYKWYEIGNKVCIEVYIKGLQIEDVLARISEEDQSILFITVKGEEHKFDLFGPVADVQIAIKKTKAEITMLSTAQPSHFPVLLKCEGRINQMKMKKYAELDKIGEQDKEIGTNAFLKQMFNENNDEGKKAMVKSMMESGGTVLSDNWGDIGSRKVKPIPLDSKEIPKEYDTDFQEKKQKKK